MANPIVIVTREESPREGRLGAALRQAGLAPRHMPLIESRRRRPDDPLLDAAIEAVRAGAWIVFTSRRAVDIWFDAMGERGMSPDAMRPTGAVWAVGESTADAIRARGWEVDHWPEAAHGDSLGNALLGAAGEGGGLARLVFPRAGKIVSDWPERAADTGVELIAPVLYDTVFVEADLKFIMDDERGERIEAITFASPSAVESFAWNLERSGLKCGGGCLMAAIGPATAGALLARLLNPVWISPSSTFPEFAAALKRRLDEGE